MSLAKFQKMLSGWMTNPDGEDLCPEHWGEYIKKFDPEIRGHIIEQSRPTFEKSIALTRKSSDGWYATCDRERADGSFCDKEVFLTFNRAQERS